MKKNKKRDLDAVIDVSEMRELKKRERTFESQLRDELKPSGVLFVKLKPTLDGLPDRLAIGSGEMRLVELKREGETLNVHQEAMHEMLERRYSIRVITVWSPDVKAASRVIIRALNPIRR